MADLSIFVRTNIAAGATSNHDFAPVPAGKTVRVMKFGALDINNGDHKSSIYLLQWGTPGSFEQVRGIALTGNTFEYEIGKVVTGDGAKFFRVMRINTSGAAKDLVFWADVLLLRG